MLFWIALWFGKITGMILKTWGKKGTTFPGLIALKIYPGIISSLASLYPEGVVIVTGTNGKTTTNNLLASILMAAGTKTAYNKEGANMLAGIAGTLLRNTTFAGNTVASILLLEVDEATVPSLCKQVSPRIVIVTNFFRDQLDRYGELDTTVKLVEQALPADCRLVLNADDPLVARIGAGKTNVCYYGAGELPSSKKESTETREGRFCGLCGRPLAYSLFHYGQLGIYACTNCGFSRPKPDLEATGVWQEESGLVFRLEDIYRVPLLGYYNLYNALAAFCAAECLGVTREYIRRGLSDYVPDAGRMEVFPFRDGKIILTLVKNPTGFNQVLQTLAGLSKPLVLLIVINDLAADGRDISWLWDVDFEMLANNTTGISRIICSGLRAEDMALRLKYAGIPEELVQMERSPEEAVSILENYGRDGETLFVLPTYTALFPMRGILAAGYAGKNQRMVSSL